MNNDVLGSVRANVLLRDLEIKLINNNKNLTVVFGGLSLKAHDFHSKLYENAKKSTF